MTTADTSTAGVALTYGGPALLFAVLAAFPATGLALAGVLVVRTRGE